MATTEVNICNIALSWLGASLITALDDETTEAELCNSNYAFSRDVALEDRDWTFATGRDTLTPSVTDPDFGFTYAFDLPAGCLRVIKADSDPYFLTNENWKREEDTIVSNATPMYIKYIKQITDPTKFSPWFVHVCAARLAADIAIAITGSKDIRDLMEQLYEVMLVKGGAMDGLQGKRDELKALKLINAR